MGINTRSQKQREGGPVIWGSEPRVRQWEGGPDRNGVHLSNEAFGQKFPSSAADVYNLIVSNHVQDVSLTIDDLYPVMPGHMAIRDIAAYQRASAGYRSAIADWTGA